MKKLKILITGANGLIGYDLCKSLTKDNEVYALSRSEVQIEGVTYLKLDLGKEEDFEKLPDNIDVIYHLAQSEHFRDFPKKSIEVFNVNTVSTLRLLEYARNNGCKQFIYASSGGVYGNGNDGFNEDEPLLNRGGLGFYLGTKFCSELLVENYSGYFDVVITRFFFVYGERQSRGMLVPRLIENIKQGNEIMLQGEEGLKINPIYVGDAVRSLIKMLELKGSNKFNIGGDGVLSLKEICEVIGKLLGKVPIYVYSEGEPRHLIGDIKKMKSMLTIPEVSFEEGVSRLIEEIYK